MSSQCTGRRFIYLFSLFLSPPLSLFLSFALSLFLPLSLSFSLPLFLSPSLPLSRSPSRPLPLSFSLPLFLSPLLFLSPPLSFSLSFSPPLFISPSLPLSLSFSLLPSLFLSLSLNLLLQRSQARRWDAACSGPGASALGTEGGRERPCCSRCTDCSTGQGPGTQALPSRSHIGFEHSQHRLARTMCQQKRDTYIHS